MRFISETLANNPTWISPLGGLIRSGSLNGLLKEVARTGDTGGLRWKGKASKWGALPPEMCVLMLNRCGSHLSEQVLNKEDVLRTLFHTQLLVAKCAFMPSRSDVRYQSALVKFAKARMEEALHYVVPPRLRESVQAYYDEVDAMTKSMEARIAENEANGSPKKAHELMTE
ncbi:unnamed protein product, partial [Symbiodinium sp. CCMP2456]